MSEVLECPSCVRPLLSLDEGGIEVPVCEGCGGVWLDRDRSERILEGDLTADEKRVAKTASRHSRTRRSKSTYRSLPERPENERHCPECHVLMRPYLVEALEIVVDGCNRHGSWFDAGELGIVIRFFELRSRGLDEGTARLVLLLKRAKKTKQR